MVYHGEIAGLSLSMEHLNGAGAKVSKVNENSTAAKSGFQVNDLIVKVGDQKIFSRDRFYGVVGTYPAGDTVEITVKRAESETRLTAVLDKFVPQGSPAGAPAPQRPPNAGWLGVVLEDHADGAAITDITPNSPAEEAGLKIGDIITQVGGQKITNVQTFQRELWKFKAGDKVKLTYKRDGKEDDAEAELAKPPQ
jgi:S1-C subfamily serine protease